MEPEKPSRQEASINARAPEHDTDDAPAQPGPRSRRGWMSDSPLDGGSGWPTSAYSIVPRPASQAGTNGATAEDSSPPAHSGASGPFLGPNRRPSAVALLGALVLALVIAVAVTFALRSAGNSATSYQSAQPSGPSEGTGSSAAQSATPGSPGPESATTDPLRSGTVRLAVIAGQPDEAFDLDSGAKEGANPDVSAGAPGLAPMNGTRFAPWAQVETPTLAGCAAAPEVQWSSSVLVAALLPGLITCVRTSEGRLAYFTARPSYAITEGQLYTTYLDFTVWRKSGD
jgi:hypothetical protein